MTAFTDPPIAVSSNPIAQKDAAETFAESTVALTSKDERIGVVGGSLQLQTIAYEPSMSGALDTSEKRGVVVEVHRDINNIDVTLAADCTATTAYLVDHSDGTVLDSASVSGGSTVTLSGNLSPGALYRIVADGGGASYTEATSGSDTFGHTYTGVKSYSGYAGSGESFNNEWNFSKVDATPYVDTLTATEIIEWPAPDDIYAWDRATFTRTEDGETVEVYIEDQNGNELAGPIERGDDIPADPSQNPRFRVDISRADTANNPTLDSIYRRYVL